MKKLYKLICVTFLLLLLPIVSEASCNVLINGKELLYYNSQGELIEPFIENGSTYLPVRAIAETFGVQISWDQPTMTVIIGEDKKNYTLNENINIFVNGEEYICHDVNNNRVNPILRDGVTYLPIRGIGQLFGMESSWDNDTRTALLSTTPSTEALSYLKNSISNTEQVPELTASINFKGNTSYYNAPIYEIDFTSTEKYGLGNFSLLSFLPSDYTEHVSYLGEGKYFMHVPPTSFISSVFVQKIVSKRTTTDITLSSLYIYLSTKGGYVTDVTIFATGKYMYGGMAFDQNFTAKATLLYPETFKFPLTPFPHGSNDPTKDFISADTGSNSDAVLISNIVEAYMNSVFQKDSRSLSKLLHQSEYDALYAKKSENQLNSELATLSKKIGSAFENASGTFSVDSMYYISTDLFTSNPAKAAEIVVIAPFPDGDKTFALSALKFDDKWYLSSQTLNSFN